MQKGIWITGTWPFCLCYAPKHGLGHSLKSDPRTISEITFVNLNNTLKGDSFALNEVNWISFSENIFLSFLGKVFWNFSKLSIGSWEWQFAQTSDHFWGCSWADHDWSIWMKFSANVRMIAKHIGNFQLEWQEHSFKWDKSSPTVQNQDKNTIGRSPCLSVYVKQILTIK